MTRPKDPFLDETSGELSEAAVGRLLASSPDRSPGEDLRARLLGAVRTTHRFEELEEACAELLDLDRRATASLLLSIDDVPSWEPGPGPAVALFHVQGGPRVADAVTGFVRVQSGGSFPDHEHVGDETVLVLQGTLEDQDGTLYRRGDVAKMPAGSHHTLRATGPVRLVYLAVVQRGVVIGGEKVVAGDPRA